eukprot:scaffold137175_cov30-Tisochrysis_lutea.AAC.1
MASARRPQTACSSENEEEWSKTRRTIWRSVAYGYSAPRLGVRLFAPVSALKGVPVPGRTSV